MQLIRAILSLWPPFVGPTDQPPIMSGDLVLNATARIGRTIKFETER